MINKLYQATNKGNNKILIVAKDSVEAIEICLILNFAKEANNVRLKDYTEIYLNEDRHQQGLNFDHLEAGQLWQEIKNNKSNWVTYIPGSISGEKLKV